MPYPDRPHPNCYWVQPGRFLAGEYPGSRDDDEARQKIEGLLAAGVTFFLDLTEPHELRPYAGLLEAAAQARGVEAAYRRLSIRDGSIPETVQQMTEILDTLDQALAAGHTVYVHCWGGIGRTGTVVGCHMVRHGRRGDEALQEIARLWQDVEKRNRYPHSPETEGQKHYILNWRESAASKAQDQARFDRFR